MNEGNFKGANLGAAQDGEILRVVGIIPIGINRSKKVAVGIPFFGYGGKQRCNNRFVLFDQFLQSARGNKIITVDNKVVVEVGIKGFFKAFVAHFS